MTKTVIVCDICHKEITVDDRIYLKRKSGKRGGEMNVDLCPACMRNIEAICNYRHPVYEFIRDINAALCDEKTDDLVFRQRIHNAHAKYLNRMIAIEEGERK